MAQKSNGTPSALNEELKIIRRLAKALESLNVDQKNRVLHYVQMAVQDEMRGQNTPSTLADYGARRSMEINADLVGVGGQASLTSHPR